MIKLLDKILSCAITVTTIALIIFLSIIGFTCNITKDFEYKI